MEKKLNKQQLQAVKHGNGPLLIIAGAGTGKTTVITERIKYLIATKKAKPLEILALTFTEKAATEMQERVDVAMPLGYTQMWISTFHSFCDMVLRESAVHIGLDPSYNLLTQAQALYFLRQNIFEFDLKYFRPLGNPTKFVYGLMQHFSRLQDENITPSQYLSWANKLSSSRKRGSKSIGIDSGSSAGMTDDKRLEIAKWLELANAYKKYDELKIQNSYLDFGDLITKTILLYKKRPNVLTDYQKKFKYILIDEFQDTNFAQNQLAEMLAEKKGNITVVADDDQSIYRFRGAAISNVLSFRKNHPKAKVISLTQNYRSYQGILDSAYKLIQFNNPDRLEVAENIDKRLVAVRDGKAKISLLHEQSAESEAWAVVNKIQDLVKNKKYEYSDIALLVRANNHADAFIKALETAEVPYQFLGPAKLFEQPEIINLIAYLRVLHNFEDSVSLLRVLEMGKLKIPAKDLIRLGNSMRKTQKSLYETILNVDSILDDNFSVAAINDIRQLIDKHIEESKSISAGQLLFEFLNHIGIYEELLNPDSLHSQTAAQNITKFFEKMTQMQTSQKDGSVRAVVGWIDLVTQLGDSPLAAETDFSAENSVKILTIHSAKGLEFPVVFILNMVSERFPTRNRSEQIPIPDTLIKEKLPEGDFHLEEERRLAYVGITRARDELIFTASDYYGEAKRKKRLSPFIFEALGEDATAAESDEPRQLALVENTKPAKVDKKIKEKRDLHIDYLSYSQIQTFQICPLHYKLRYILKVPTPPSHAQSFGISIHETMNEMYAQALAGKKITKNYLFKLLEKHWLTAGYDNKKHQMLALSRAKRYLEQYLKDEYDPKRLPLALEKPFVINISNKGQRLKLGGKIDRIDKNKNGIEIIDYKTGENVPDQRQVDRDMQLSFYALAATRIDEKPLGVLPNKVKLTLYYFEENKKITTTRTKTQLKELEKQVFDIKKQIEESAFRCSGHPWCSSCEYKLYCKAQS